MANNAPASITRADVAKVLAEMQEDGDFPTVRSVRERLGNRGSLATISKHLSALREGWGKPELYLGQFPSKLEALCLSMGEMMDALASERTAHMSALLEDERRDLARQKSTLMHERELAVAALEAEKRTSDELRARLESTTHQRDSAVTELDELRPRLAKADLLNEQLHERVTDGAARVQRLQEHIENYRDEVKKQRQIDADKHAATVSSLEQALNNTRASELRLTEKLGVYQRENDKITVAQRLAEERAESAERDRDKFQALVADLSIEQTNSKKREQEREQRLSLALSEKEVSAEKLSSLQEQLIAAQSNVEKLRQSGAAESRSLIINLIDHSRRVFALASKSVKKGDSEMHDLAIAQKEIERLFDDAG